jgi:hypothetical protein
MKTLLICFSPFLMMLATSGLLLSCGKPTAWWSPNHGQQERRCTAEAVPASPPDVTVKVLEANLGFVVRQVRVESEKITCWVVTGSGSGISCLADGQRNYGRNCTCVVTP